MLGKKPDTPIYCYFIFPGVGGFPLLEDQSNNNKSNKNKSKHDDTKSTTLADPSMFLCGVPAVPTLR